MRLIAVLLFLAAAFATLVAGDAYWALCLQTDAGPCVYGSGPEWELVAQLITGALGLVPAALMVYFAFRRRSKPFLFFLALALLTYAAWGILLDASVHGWENVGPL